MLIMLIQEMQEKQLINLIIQKLEEILLELLIKEIEDLIILKDLIIKMLGLIILIKKEDWLLEGEEDIKKEILIE